MYEIRLLIICFWRFHFRWFEQFSCSLFWRTNSINVLFTSYCVLAFLHFWRFEPLYLLVGEHFSPFLFNCAAVLPVFACVAVAVVVLLSFIFTLSLVNLLAVLGSICYARLVCLYCHPVRFCSPTNIATYFQLLGYGTGQLVFFLLFFDFIAIYCVFVGFIAFTPRCSTSLASGDGIAICTFSKLQLVMVNKAISLLNCELYVLVGSNAFDCDTAPLPAPL